MNFCLITLNMRIGETSVFVQSYAFMREESPAQHGDFTAQAVTLNFSK